MAQTFQVSSSRFQVHSRANMKLETSNMKLLAVVYDSNNLNFGVPRDLAIAHDDQPGQVGGSHLLQAGTDLRTDEHDRPLARASELGQLGAEFFAQLFDRLRGSADEQSALGVLDAGRDPVLQRRVKRQDEQPCFGVAIAAANGAGQSMTDVFGKENQVLGFAGVVAERFQDLAELPNGHF